MDRPAILGGAPILDRAKHRLWPIVGDEEKRNVMRVLEDGILSGWAAPFSRELEEEWASACGVKHALLTHSGTSALEIGVMASGIGPGDEVIMPAYSFVATPLSVSRCGATPVFVDVDEATGLIDPALAEAAITPKTRAIMPVHVHGLMAPMNELAVIAKKHDLLILEDAAQAHLATYEGKRAGSLGAWAAFSLQSSKNFCAGEGGIFVTGDDRLAEAANRARNFGQDVSLAESGFDRARPLDGHFVSVRPGPGPHTLESIGPGSMYRGNEMMAAFALGQLSRLEKLTRLAQENAARLSAALRELPGVLPPEVPEGRTHVYHKYRVRFVEEGVSPQKLRDAMVKALRAEGCEIVFWQSAPLAAQRVFSGLGGSRQFPRTESMLACSLLMFSQSCPLIAQDAETVDRYAEAARRCWTHRREILSSI